MEPQYPQYIHGDTISQLFTHTYAAFLRVEKRIQYSGHANSKLVLCHRAQAVSDETIDRSINRSRACDIFPFSITMDELLRRIITTYATNEAITKRRRKMNRVERQLDRRIWVDEN